MRWWGRLVGKDVALAAGVIKAANSPYFGLGRTIVSIDEAIRLMGFARLSNLVLGELLRKSVGAGEASLERFWDNSACTASICAELAGRLPGTSRDTAYAFGLFHDCGIPLMTRRFPNYKDVLREANTDTSRLFTGIEEQALGTHHAAIGALMARSWGLPDMLTEAVLMHHDYSVLSRSAGLSEESCTLIALSLIAERVAGLFLRLRQDAEWIKGREAVASFFRMDVTELEELCEDVLFKFDHARNLEDGHTTLEA